jgi:hypothetical protein
MVLLCTTPHLRASLLPVLAGANADLLTAHPPLLRMQVTFLCRLMHMLENCTDPLAFMATLLQGTHRFLIKSTNIRMGCRWAGSAASACGTHMLCCGWHTACRARPVPERLVLHELVSCHCRGEACL